ncbi:predicted protein [Sclerotinia sclerotiorum 1980 UF-70]|uniref:Uncharacterized protein n=1 Tax=Sclerotinia sclerotiorum (strain ATCC 18683 / 1980 / Ss-1) TaxID=665079 RepID=A7ETP7_SCLS1|nr:predicted protein [Sclerotinia sclerotiorum 1980 UF-70]EDN92839.1 predicted protein [Sclerotinia sclerotiorum 1980 UF-70]
MTNMEVIPPTGSRRHSQKNVTLSLVKKLHVAAGYALSPAVNNQRDELSIHSIAGIQVELYTSNYWLGGGLPGVQIGRGREPPVIYPSGVKG